MIIFFSLQICHLKRGNWCLNLRRHVIKRVQTTLRVPCSPYRNEARLSALTRGQEDSKDEEKPWREDAAWGRCQPGNCCSFPLPRWHETHQTLGSSTTRVGTRVVVWGSGPALKHHLSSAQRFSKQKSQRIRRGLITWLTFRHVWVCCCIGS